MRSNTTRDVRRADNRLIKTRILHRPSNHWVRDGYDNYINRYYQKGIVWRDRRDGCGWHYCSEAEIQDGKRGAFRNGGKSRRKDYGCGRTCILCNPEIRYDMPVRDHRTLVRLRYEEWEASQEALP